VVMEMTPMKTSVWWRASKAAGITNSALEWLKPVLPKMLARYLP
jgi:hypothetical protein